ncbi:hypothetical protein BT93_C0871 [Corymbia citriodora subsp. variegata]|nr:hypothetical protein BT93_C0871 [Corymbia citriodora subsp. variegata]
MASLSGIFPCDVVVEILARLPARSVIQFRRVSKSWRSLLSGQYFATMWLNRSGSSLLVLPLEWDNRDECSLVFENVTIGRRHLMLPVSNQWLSLSLVGSSGDGSLICLAGLSYVRQGTSKVSIILWKPFRDEVRFLSQHGYIYCNHRSLCSESQLLGYSSGCCNQYQVHGFGYVPNAQDYKIVRITYSRGGAAAAPIRPWHIEVYSLGQNKWTSHGRPSFTWMIRGNSRAYVNGAAHWLAAPTEEALYDSIVAFGLEEESFRRVFPLPRTGYLSQFSLHARGKATLSVLHGSLALIAFTLWNREECGIWVMGKYGVDTSWTKQHHIVLPMGATCRAALGLTWHDKIVLRMVDERLVYFDLQGVQITEVGVEIDANESSFDVIDLGRGNPTLRNQGDPGFPLPMLDLE